MNLFKCKHENKLKMNIQYTHSYQPVVSGVAACDNKGNQIILVDEEIDLYFCRDCKHIIGEER